VSIKNCVLLRGRIASVAREMERSEKQKKEKLSLRVQLARQLAIFLNNRPGTLARLCDALSEEKINIYALSTSDTVDHIVVRMIVSDPVKALSIFDERGSLAISTDVLMIDGSNKPGSLASIAHCLAESKINIEYLYCATHPDSHKGLLIMRVSDAKKALKVLNT
jgi:hypothetical protein